MRRNSIWPRFIVVHGVVWIEHDADESAQDSLPLETVGVDDLDAGVRAIGKVVLAFIRIDEADIERAQWLAGDVNCRQAFGLDCGR